MLQEKDYIDLIIKALNEDLSDIGDVTSEPLFDKNIKASFILISKDEGILCGKDIFSGVFKLIDEDCSVEFYSNDGDPLKNMDIVARVTGSVVSILKGERTSLNFISHLSGIATKTKRFVEETGGKVEILDTRKTIPGLRTLQKYAVSCGGGKNHRMGLYDMVLIKDNHIDAAGGIKNAVESIKNKWGNKYKIEVETRNFDEIKQALDCNVDIIMLDNMDNSTIEESVKIINKMAKIEVSGNMTIERIKDVADTGIDYISFGELTHTVKAYDFSLKKEK